jgi:TRAP-type mannitol/chloroaromatic compound transport system permease small subunit
MGAAQARRPFVYSTPQSRGIGVPEMMGFILFVDKVTAWAGKAFAWCILIMTFGVSYEVFVRYVLGDPTSWAFDISYMMYGALFMMAGAHTLARDGHVRGDVLYRLWKPRIQATVELTLYFLFFFPGILALIFAGMEYANESWFYGEVSVMSPANVPRSHLPVQDHHSHRRGIAAVAGRGASVPRHPVPSQRRMAGPSRRRG